MTRGGSLSSSVDKPQGSSRVRAARLGPAVHPTHAPSALRRDAMLVRRLGLIAVVAGVVACAAPAAQAATRTYTFRAGPIAMSGFQTRLPKVQVPAPGVNGFVRAMRVRLVYASGRQVSIRSVMLHHIVFLNDGASTRAKRGSCAGRYGEPFYGTGEEHERLILPAGYGYP